MRHKCTPNQFMKYEDGVALLLTSKGKLRAVAWVDEEDLGRILAYGRWYARDSKGGAYVVSSRGMKLHRFIMNPPVGMVVDHKNHDRMDCRKRNMRVCTQAQNCMNMKVERDSKSGIKNVCWDKRRSKWVARVSVDGRRKVFGSFDSIEEAEAAAAAGRRLLHGEFAA